ncbi:MAG: hypothetical protein CFH06_00308 [Alphaproteobacteria bacterium MarineAlpha3_Bin5]|nr:MAG: hypothetical protein CFH06_00308 [Alphaproteobacteria bacterium MarineAlpha3_Bin5]
MVGAQFSFSKIHSFHEVGILNPFLIQLLTKDIKRFFGANTFFHQIAAFLMACGAF